MSGLEIVGIAASIIQIADLGAKLSVKLCEFYRQIKSANQSLESLSSDVAITCSILRELGENLKQDEETKLCSTGAFHTAQEVLRECESVFTQIRNTIEVQAQEQDPSRNRFYRAFRKVGIALIERDLLGLRGNLDRLRSTTLLLLNVIMYAGQVRSHAGTAILQQQREMIDMLMKEKRANDEKFNQLQQTMQIARSGTYILPVLDINGSMSNETPSQLDQFPQEVRQYYHLVKALFAHIDAYESTIEQWQHLRIRDGVARINLDEVSYLASRHGPKVHELFSGPYFRPSGPGIMGNTAIISGMMSKKRGRPARERNSRALVNGAASRIELQRTRQEESSDVLSKRSNVESPVPSRNDPPGAAPVFEEPDSPSPFALEHRRSSAAEHRPRRAYSVDTPDDDDINNILQLRSRDVSTSPSGSSDSEGSMRLRRKRRKTVGDDPQEIMTEPSHATVDTTDNQDRHGAGMSDLLTRGKQTDIDNTVDTLVLMWTTLDKNDLLT